MADGDIADDRVIISQIAMLAQTIADLRAFHRTHGITDLRDFDALSDARDELIDLIRDAYSGFAKDD